MRRRDQNQTKKEWDAFLLAVDQLDSIVTTVLLRGTHGSGIRRAAKSSKVDPEGGTPPPAWADPTGETAIRDEIGDSVERSVLAMSQHVHHALNIAKAIIEITPADVTERAVRSIPDCFACGDPCHGRVRGGFDEKCHKRWDRSGRPDRVAFIAMVKRERLAESEGE